MVEKVILVPSKLEPIIVDTIDPLFTAIVSPDSVEYVSVPIAMVDPYKLDKVNVLP